MTLKLRSGGPTGASYATWRYRCLFNLPLPSLALLWQNQTRL